MGCGRNNVGGTSDHHDKGCVCEVVKTILELQNRAVRHHDCDSCGTSCFVEPLGGIKHPARHADTRVFMLLNKDGTPFTALARLDDNGKNKDGKGGDKGGGKNKNDNNFFVSPFFRVEDVFGDCCATLRVIAPVEEDNNDAEVIEVIGEDGFFDVENLNDVNDFEKTEFCVTVDLEKFAAVQCIADVDLDICKHK